MPDCEEPADGEEAQEERNSTLAAKISGRANIQVKCGINRAERVTELGRDVKSRQKRQKKGPGRMPGDLRPGALDGLL